jgi:hypothetical protein
VSRVFQSFVFILVVLSAVAVAAPTEAQTVGECQVAIAELRETTLAVTSFTNANDQAGLVGKLNSAETKLEQEKLDDSVQALIQFQTKVITLNEQGKIDGGDARALVNGAGSVISCVSSLPR